MKTCEQCSKPLSGRQRRFCSDQCKSDWFAGQRKQATMESREGRRCSECGGPIPMTLDRRAVVCSAQCRMVMRNRVRVAERHAKNPGATNCAQCGRPIVGRRNTARFCSDACRDESNGELWRQRGSGYMREYLYGLTPDQFATMLADQEGRCAICRADSPGGKGGWHVDHDHQTGTVRGLLCHGCNLGLGNFVDDPGRLRAAADYLAGESGRK